MKHIHGVLSVLNSQTEPELGVGPDVVVHSSGRLLSGQDQMDAQASSYLSHRHQLSHEIRLFPLQLGELVDDDKHVGDGLFGAVALIQGCVSVNVVDPVVAEDPLPPLVLRLDGHHGPLYLVAGQVGDCADHVGQAFEEVGHAAAFVIDDEKSHVVGAVVDGQRQHVCLKGL